MSWDSELRKYRRKSHEGEVTLVPSEAISITNDEPWSLHLTDPFLESFLSPTFDPADYLNNNLSFIDRTNVSDLNKGSSFINDIFPVAQNLVSQLSANSTRLTTILTQLTDEILRSGNRLAYEVEILRENTLNLSEALVGVLHDDLAKFVPTVTDNSQKKDSEALEMANSTSILKSHALENHEPSFVKELRTLTLVRSRLEKVIKTFGDAMLWSFPPSEVSTAASFLSVSGPDISSGLDGTSIEEKGQQVSKKIRSEISELLSSDDPISGIESAAKRVEELKELVIVWKGTAEERARLKFIENLARMVEDRHRDLLRVTENDSCNLRKSKIVTVDDKSEENKPLAGYGFINHLQKLRGS